MDGLPGEGKAPELGTSDGAGGERKLDHKLDVVFFCNFFYGGDKIICLSSGHHNVHGCPVGIPVNFVMSHMPDIDSLPLPQRL